MAEIQFADGKQVVDDAYAPAISELTSGHPERFPFRDVMDRIGSWFEKDFLRREQRRIVGDHLSRFGL